MLFRSHGQKNAVQVYYLVFEGSLDAYMVKTIIMKEKIIENVREGLLKVQKWLGEYINNEDMENTFFVIALLAIVHLQQLPLHRYFQLS